MPKGDFIMNFKRLTAIILTCVILLSSFSIGFAYKEDFGKDKIPNDFILEDVEIITPDLDEYNGEINKDNFIYEKISHPSIQVERRIVDDESDLGETDRVLTGYIYEKKEKKENKGSGSDISPMEWGSGGPVAKIFLYKSASNGLLRRGSKIGSYISIATTILPFLKTWSMSVQAIFASTGMAVSAGTYSQGETYTSQLYYYKDGRVRAASDPDSEAYYYTAIVTGRSETFRHVMSATQDPTTLRWSTKWADIAQVIDPKSSTHYSDSQYILNYALNYFYLGNYYDETATIY